MNETVENVSWSCTEPKTMAIALSATFRNLRAPQIAFGINGPPQLDNWIDSDWLAAHLEGVFFHHLFKKCSLHI
jgi:hypothetical protein